MNIIDILQKLAYANFGSFKEEEFKKFLRMGCIFLMIIGIYWTLRPLKDALFIQLVGKFQLPYAKTVSVMALLPLVMLYTKLVAKNSKEKMLVYLPLFYGIAILAFTGVIFFAQNPLLKNFLGYFWYLFIESFGSLMVALFWAFATDTTEASQAKRGFPLVVALGQIGGIVFPYAIGGLPYRLGHSTDILSMFLLGLMTLSLIPLVRSFFKNTPANELHSIYSEKKEESQDEPGFLEGLKLLLNHRYLLGIFFVNFIYEIVITIFDFNFKLVASSHYSGVALSNYLSYYGSIVNIVSLTCLMLGISNITRFLGLGVALATMPVVVGLALLGFLNFNSLSFFFALMVGSKAVNYALNGPALKQLYIPTTPDVKFKAQAWIETFGSRSSKQVGSFFNMTLAPLQRSFGAALGNSYYVALSGIICFPLLALWFMMALFLGKSFKKAIATKRTIC